MAIDNNNIIYCDPFIKCKEEMNNQESITTEVNSLYSLCSFDISMFNITDHFCAIFDEDESAILEYYNDFGDYYKKGYGHPINYEISCPLLKDFFNISDSFINGDEATKAKLRFAHAETHMPIISLLVCYYHYFIKIIHYSLFIIMMILIDWMNE